MQLPLCKLRITTISPYRVKCKYWNNLIQSMAKMTGLKISTMPITCSLLITQQYLRNTILVDKNRFICHNTMEGLSLVNWAADTSSLLNKVHSSFNGSNDKFMLSHRFHCPKRSACSKFKLLSNRIMFCWNANAYEIFMVTYWYIGKLQWKRLSPVHEFLVMPICRKFVFSICFLEVIYGRAWNIRDFILMFICFVRSDWNKFYFHLFVKWQIDNIPTILLWRAQSQSKSSFHSAEKSSW